MESLRKSQLVVTRGVHEKIEQDSEFAKGVYTSLRRYYSGDWGDLCDEDKEMNEMALKCGDRIFAMYKLGNDKIYIITEWDRSVTTILFPSEY